MNSTSTGYLTFSLSPNGFLSDFNAPLHQILVVKQQMLFQTGVGNTAGFGTLLYRDVAVRTQKFHSLGVLLFAVLTCAPQQVVTQAQPLAYLLPPVRTRVRSARRCIRCSPDSRTPRWHPCTWHGWQAVVHEAVPA